MSFKIDPGGGPYPERAVQPGKDCVDDACGNSLRCSITLEMSAVIAVKAVLRAHPKVTSSILSNCRDVRVAEPFGVDAEAVALRFASSRAKAKERKDGDEAP